MKSDWIGYGSASGNWTAFGALMMLALLAACAATPTTGTRDVCMVWQSVSYSGEGDTPETVAQIRLQNARRKVYCQ